MLFILLILFFISFFMFNFSYLFSVLLMVFFILLFVLIHLFSLLYLKYLIILVYISGIVVFILYISCMCWNMNEKFSLIFLIFSIFIVFMFDSGVNLKFSDVGDFFWMYLFFSVIFSFLVTIYSLNLFKVSGSLRF